MKDEVIELIKAFDLPYLIAPYEAEAQCANLRITWFSGWNHYEDSDCFLFGGRNLYKHLFQHQKFIETYQMTDIIKN